MNKLDKREIVEDILKLKNFVENHKEMIFSRIQHAGKTVIEMMKMDKEQLETEQDSGQEYYVILYAGCIPFINSVIQVGSTPINIRKALSTIDLFFKENHHLIDTVAILSKNTLFYIIEYCINYNEDQIKKYNSNTEEEKDKFWKTLIEDEQNEMKEGEIEPNMLTLGHKDKEHYWAERKTIWKLIKNYFFAQESQNV